jgi:DNA ligase (NAD+)
MSEFDFDKDVAGNADERKHRIADLTDRIKKYQNSYYNGESEIPDAEFDKLWDELKVLDPYNELIVKIGADNGNFGKIRHIMPMGSQEKAADAQQFLSWSSVHNYDEYLVEFKLDGASLELQYIHGDLVHAVTRGDGTIGDDITENARKMEGVKVALYNQNGKKIDYTGGVRGEVIMKHEIHDTYYSDKANCRNAANGLMKRKDGKGCEYLTLIAYDAFATGGIPPFQDEEEKIIWLGSCGFITVVLKICSTADEVIDYRSSVMNIRKDLDYDIDGLVVKERKINTIDAFRARPERQIAFKFNLEEAVSIVRSVEWSESGATYTPVAVFDPVILAGTTVQRASLANPDTVRTLGVQIGSRVVVVKRGEIIPKIESVFLEDRVDSSLPGQSRIESLKPVTYPVSCGTCGSILVDDGSRLFCPNMSCPKRILHRLQKWVSVVDIRDLGDVLLKALFNCGKVTSISDLYSLTADDLVPFFLNEESVSAQKDSLGAQKVALSLQSHRSISLAAFIAGFDIDGIGETMAQKLVDAGFDTLEKLLSANVDQFSSVYGFGEVMAKTTVAGLLENATEMKYLANEIIKIHEAASAGKLSGKSFCFTGELYTLKRADAENMVKKSGGVCKSSVTKDLSYLVTNDTSSGSSKNIRAVQLGIPIISEQDFLALLSL